MEGIKTMSYKYFVGAADVGGKTNTYTGSLTLNKDVHNAFEDEFKYRISLKEADDGDRFIIAECYVGKYSFDNTPPESIATLEFEGSDNGVASAKQWLEQAYQKVKEATN